MDPFELQAQKLTDELRGLDAFTTRQCLAHVLRQTADLSRTQPMNKALNFISAVALYLNHDSDSLAAEAHNVYYDITNQQL